MNQAGACLFAEVGRSAKGGAAFRTREEARHAWGLGLGMGGIGWGWLGLGLGLGLGRLRRC